MTKDPSAKYHLGMAGEFFVAAQLQRLGLSASVTYGHAKSADVVAFVEDSNRVVVIEVKTTRQPEWTFSGRIRTDSEKPWVFVYLPEESKEAPRYFILTQTDLHAILAPFDDEWSRRFKEKNGADFDEKSWVVNVSRKWLKDHENKWEAITDQLKA